MDYKEFKFKLDMNRYNRLNIQPVQGESAVKLIPTLVHNSQPYNLMDSEVRCLFRKPDGTVSYIDGVILDADKGEVEFKLTNQVLLLSGSVVGLIDVTGTIGIARTWMFTMDVQPGILISDVISIDEFPAVEQMLIDVADIKANFNAIVAGVTVDGEVILSRGVFDTLQERLDYIDENKANQSEVNAILTSLDEIVTDFTTDLNTIETQQITQDIRLAGQINNLVETTKPLVPDVKVSTYKPVSTLSPNSQEGQMNVKVLGQTLKNEVKNGDFRDGITGWDSEGLTLSTISTDLVATITSLSIGSYVRKPAFVSITGNKYYVRADIKPKYSNSLKFVIGDKDSAAFSGVANQVKTYSDVVTTISTAPLLVVFDVAENYIIGDTINIKDCMIINLTQRFGAGKEPTKEQMDEMVQHYFDGLSSVQAGTVKTVGKNLFDKNRVNKGKFLVSDGQLSTHVERFHSHYIPLKPSVTYTSSFNSTFLDAYSIYYDENKNYISTVNAYVSYQFTPPSNARYMRISSNIVDLDKIQIEEGTTVTPYEQYQETVYSLPEVKLHSLPNGVKDVIEGNRLIKNIGEHVLKAEDIEALNTTLVNVDMVGVKRINIPNIHAMTAGVTAPMTLLKDYTASKLATFTSVALDSVSNLSTYISSASYSGGLWLFVPKGAYTTLTLAKEAFTGTKILYQLAEPIITELPPMTLKSNPKGSVIYLNSRKVISSYTTKAETTVPIKTITKITKVLTDGTRIPVSVNIGIVIATDKLSFTHSSLVNGDNIEWEYEFDSSITTSPLIEYGYENSNGEFPARNVIMNGDFSKGTEGWAIRTGYGGVLAIENGRAKFSGGSAYSGFDQAVPMVANCKVYVRIKWEGDTATYLQIWGSSAQQKSSAGLSTDSLIITSNGLIGFGLRNNIANAVFYADDIIAINLTETFGAGNEPTKEQMDKIMELHGGWFDGTVNPLINARQAFNLMVKNVQEGWLTPTLLNGWVENTPVRYRRNQFGTVIIKGSVKSGLMNQPVLTLPIGYRPTETRLFSIGTDSSTQRLTALISSGGTLTTYNPYTNWVTLEIVMEV